MYPSLHIEQVESETKILLINKIQGEIFGEDAWDIAKDLAIWKMYKPGLVVLCDPSSNTIEAFMSLWPIAEEIYSGLESGDISDSEVSPQDIVSSGHSNYWWIGSLYVDPKFRSRYPRIVDHLIHETFLKWALEHPSQADITIVSTGWSRAGRILLHKYGFRKVSGLDGDSTFTLECPISDLT